MTLSWPTLTTAGALVLALAAAPAFAPGCAPAGDEASDEGAAGTLRGLPSFEAFRAATYREPWPGGHYVVEGDLPLRDEGELRAYYDGLRFGATALVVGTDEVGRDLLLPPERRLDLSYCVDQTFSATERTLVLESLPLAAARWEAVADVRFRHVAARDANCVAGAPDVYFAVTKSSDPKAFRAKAFFPDFEPADRKLFVSESALSVNASAFDDVMTHEFGHILGFRHEHARKEVSVPDGPSCTEDNEGWRAFTPYDVDSVMGYLECTGRKLGEFQMSPRDEWAARTIYGAPGRRQPVEGTPVSYRTPMLMTNTFVPLGVHFRARAGSSFVAVLRGGTPNDAVALYARVGRPTELGQTDGCAPAFDAVGVPQVCRVEIPPGGDVDVYLGVRAGRFSTRVNGALSIIYVQGG